GRLPSRCQDPHRAMAPAQQGDSVQAGGGDPDLDILGSGFRTYLARPLWGRVKVLCVGRNYAKHAQELGKEVPESPIWFWKPDSAIIEDGAELILPPGVGPVHHEVELAVRIGTLLRKVGAEKATRHIDALTVANDATA